MADEKERDFKKDFKKYRLEAEYIAVRVLVFCLALLPFRLARWVGRRLGEIWRLVDGNHRRRSEEQVREILGLSVEESREFVKVNFRHLGMTLAEFALLSRMTASAFERRVDMGPLRRIAEPLFAEGKGIIFITGHYGNWEWCNTAGNLAGMNGGSIARPLDNPKVNEYVKSIREKNGMKILDKGSGFKHAMRLLLNNGVMGVLIDQDSGSMGMMSPFLGNPASTTTVAQEIAMRTGSPMLVVVMKRELGKTKPFTLVICENVIRFDANAPDVETEMRRVVDLANDQLGKIIMREPEQWLWMHRRWKSTEARVKKFVNRRRETQLEPIAQKQE